jgi:hypothetical protein
MKANEAAYQPVFPINPEGQSMTTPGLTKLELFSAMAMQGLASNVFWLEQNRRVEDIAQHTADNAIVLARALLSELEKVTP